MSVLNKIAYFRNRRDEVPNQELARELAQTRNTADIREIAENIWNKEANIQSDCLKVLYELGYLAPELIADYAGDFLKLLKHRSNRMVWGGMIALSTIAALQADELFGHLPEIIKTMEAGTVITNDAGIKILADMAPHKEEYRARIVPYLLQRLADARPVDAARYADRIVGAAGPAYKAEFIRVLEKRMEAASGSRLARLKKVHREAEKIA
jgi:hypothetical protein